MRETLTRPEPRRAAAIIGAVGVVLLALLAALLSPLSAHAAPVTLSGKVVGPTGSAVSGLTVTIVEYGDGDVAGTATTSSSGSFTIAGLDAGEYTLSFPRTSTSYAQFLGGALDREFARPLVLDVGTTSTMTAALAPSGALSGTVKTSGGSAISGASVTVYGDVDGEWQSIRTATTNSSGVYTVTGLAPSEYVVRALKGTSPAVYSGNAASIENATPVAVFAQKTAKSDFRLGSGAKITGIVRGDEFGTPVPLAGVTVTAWRFVGYPGDDALVEQVGTTAVTSATGAYTIGTLPPGEYTLYFDTADGSSYGAQYFGGGAEVHEATAFTVASGATVTGKNVLLGAGGGISGLVRVTGTLAPIENMRVSLFGHDDQDTTPLATTYTESDGSYGFTGLGLGDYSVVAGAFEASATNPSETIAYQRKSFSNIGLGAGLTYDLANITVALRPDMVPTPGQEPSLSLFGTDWEVGTGIAVSTGTWPSSGYGVTGGYAWYRDGVRIPGVSTFSYTPRPGDVGHTITARANRVDWSYGPGSYETAASPVIAAGDAPTPLEQPSVTGISRVGEQLTVDVGRWEVIDHLGGPDETDPGILWTVTWQRSTNNSTWSDLPTVGLVHTVSADDLDSGPYLRAVLNGTRDGYADVVDHATLARYVEMGDFTNVTLPKVTKTSTQLVATSGTWKPAPATIDYEWRVYNPVTLASTIYGGTTLARSIAGTNLVELKVSPAAPNVDGSPVTIVAQAGAAIAATGASTVTGDARVGQVLSAPAYTWVPTPDATSYVWQYYTGTSWKTVAGASSSSYLVEAKYKGKKLRVITTVTKPGYASAKKTSTSTASVKTGLAVVNTVAPSIASGAAAINTTVTIDPGTWTPAATSYSYQWRTRTSPGGTPSTISGATSASYTPPTSAENKYLEVIVTAKRTGHSNAVTVLDLGQITSGVLKNTIKPKVTTIAPQQFQVTSNGTWSPSATANYHAWIRLNVDGTENNLGGASPFDASAGALWVPLDVVVYAGRGGYSDGSVRLQVKDGTFNVAVPAAMSGTGKVGQALTADAPELTNPPQDYGYSYQWQYKSSTGWKSISGATNADFTPSASYFGKDVRVRVRVTAERYTTHETVLPHIRVIAGDPIVPGGEPTVSGASGVGQKRTANAVSWSVSSPSLSYQWQSGASASGPFTNIAGATSSSYTPGEGQFGTFVRVVITAKKTGYANGVAETDATEVTTRPVGSTSKPKITKSGNVLTVSAGGWDVSGVSLSYSWTRLSLDGLSATSSASGTSYTLTPADEGHIIYAEVTAQKLPYYTAGVAGVVAQTGVAIRPVEPITISGELVNGQMLTSSEPEWMPVPTSVTRQWLRNGVAITGATGVNYFSGPADIGKTIALKVTATFPGAPSYTTTITAGMIASEVLPENLTAPSYTVTGGGALKVGTTVTAHPGTWSVASMSYAYQWYRGSVKITGGTSSSYAVVAGDEDRELWVEVTASKAGWVPTSAISASRTVGEGDAVALTSGLTISVSSGSLRANTLAWAKPVTVTYRWMRSTDNGTSWEAVGTASTHPLAGATTGTQFRLDVLATRPGHADAEHSSNVYIVP